jgi:hypothetical protein
MTSPVLDSAYGQLYKVADYWHTKFEANKVSLGLADVFYGDQKQIPRTPALCIEPDGKKRDLSGAPRRTENTFGIYFLLYVSTVASVETNARDALVLGETIETFLHQDPTCHTAPAQPLVVHGYCVEVEPGYRTRGDTLYRACRIKYEAINKTCLGM